MEHPTNNRSTHGQQSRGRRRTKGILWTSTTALTLLCCFTSASGPENTAWATAAMGHVRALSDSLFPRESVPARVQAAAMPVPPAPVAKNVVFSMSPAKFTFNLVSNPTVPSGLQAAVQYAGPQPHVTLNWSTSQGAALYMVLRDQQFLQMTRSGTAQDANVQPGQTHTYAVYDFQQANTTSGSYYRFLGPPASVTMTVTPPSPTGVTAAGQWITGSGGGAARIALAWNAVTGAKSYNISRNGAALATTNVPGYMDTSVTGGRTYSYSVCAVNAGGTGPQSAPASATAPSPPAPTAAIPPAPAPTAALTPVGLPIEVMGADGTTVAAQVSIPAATSVTGLWIQVNNLSYPDKASVQVNGGPWMPLDNTTVQVAEPGKSYGGIGGAFGTLKMVLPLSGQVVNTGTNTIAFRFNHTDGVSSGFRVLDFNFLDAQGNPVLPASAFAEDDPNTWQPPLPGAQDIAAGQTLWQGAQLMHSSLVHTMMLATCADCHTDDGRDLKYFNFSNNSIIKRAQFHGLSQTQGEQIASYIRTLNVPNPGRPWNPPYQPGPGLDEKPVQDWAAGAGVDAVLDKSSDMLPYIFPSGLGSSLAANAADIAADKNLNTRELPISIQLPDWNHWLPATWPGEIAGAGFATSLIPSRYKYAQTLAAAAANAPTQANMASLHNNLNAFIASLIMFEQTPAVNPSMFFTGGVPAGGVPLTTQQATALYSVALWGRVKEWGIMQTYGIEDKGQALYGQTAANGAPTEDRVWFSSGTFQTAPSFDGIYGAGSGGPTAAAWAAKNPSAPPINQEPLSLSPLAAGTPTLYHTLEGQWYYLQMILNAGNRHRNGNDPIDWGYVPGELDQLAVTTRVGIAGEDFAVKVKAMQQFNNGYAPDRSNSPSLGWEIRESHLGLLGDFSQPLWGSIPTATKSAVDSAFLLSWLTATEQYTPAQYWTQGEISQTTTTAQARGGAPGSPDAAQAMYAIVPVLNRAGADPALMNNYVAWLQNVLPNVDWANDK